ncbi:MAG TPA: pseudouridine synthase [Oculatellaceae cyanobacterium]
MDTSISILYRDSRMIVVDKPSGMLVHRGWGKDQITAADIIRDEITHCKIYGVHRLDRGTSGTLMFALDSEMARYIQQELQEGKIEKRYVALARGPMLEPCTLDHPILMKETGRRVDAITEFEPLMQAGRWSLVEARPLTGRLHQIRRHLKHLNHPIVGDVRWGKGEINRMFREEHGLHRMALHCYFLKFKQPDGSSVSIESSLPQDLVAPLKSLGMWPLPERLQQAKSSE